MYCNEYLRMTIYKTAKKKILHKKSSCKLCIAEKPKIRHITVLKFGKTSMNDVKPQTNHNKRENTTLRQTT